MQFELQIRGHAMESPSAEVCGLVVREPDGKLQAIRTPNTADNPADSFRIPPALFLEIKATNDLVGYYHSHPHNGVEPSQHDRDVSEDLALPAFIFSVERDQLGAFVPDTFKQPLIGRKFCPLVGDCVTLVWDYFLEVLGIELPFLPRKQTDYYRGVDFDFRSILEETNSAVVVTPQRHDVIAMTLYHCRRPNHLAVYLGDNLILHQTSDRNSVVDVYGGLWEKATCHIFRHPMANGRPAWRP